MLASCTAVLVGVGLVLARQALSSSLPPAGSSVMKCTGNVPRTRACIFQNLFYDRRMDRFLFYGVQSLRALPLGIDEPPLDNPDRPQPFLQLGRVEWEKERSQNRFYMEWKSPDERPGDNETCVLSVPVHARSPFSTHSYGHFIRDNLQALVEIPKRFGQDPSQFTWVKWKTGHRYSSMWINKDSRVMDKYVKLLTDNPSTSWMQLIQQECRSEEEDRFVRVEKMVAGAGGVDYIHGPANLVSSPHCSTERFQNIRNIAYDRFGVQALPVGALDRVKVVFLGHQEGERRGIVNVHELLPALRVRFPTMDFEQYYMTNMTLEEQLNVLSNTSILVANVGSASFRLVLLPDGAQTILIGAPEYNFTGTDNAIHEPINAFREAQQCWMHVGYVSVLQYHMNDPQDVFPGPGRLELKGRNNWRFQRSRMWDANVRVDPGRLGDIMDLALVQLALS